MYFLLQKLFIMKIFDLIFLSHVVSTIFANDLPKGKNMLIASILENLVMVDILKFLKELECEIPIIIFLFIYLI